MSESEISFKSSVAAGNRKDSSGRLLSKNSRVFDIGEEPLLQTARKAAHKACVTYLPTSSETKGFTWLDWLGYFLPCVTWLRTYDVKGWLLNDILAGLSVGAMVIPQGMSYASLAGLPYVYGLYGAFIPCIVYSLFGSSRQLAVGPVAVTSMLLGTGLSNIFNGANDNPNSPDNPQLQEEYNHAAIQVAFLAGIMYTGVGLLRLGWLTNFLSHTTISGFMSGACIVIALSQVKYILGLKLPRSDKIVESLQNIFEGLGDPKSWSKSLGGPGRSGGFSWQEFTMGMAFMFLLLVFKFLGGRYKRLSLLKALGPLTVCVISIALMNIFKWYEVNPNNIMGGKPAPTIKPVGYIPKGLPQFTGGWFFPLYAAGQQVLLSVLICLIDVCESISIARALAQKNHYRLNPTQELRGLGFANVAGALFNCYTTTGSFSRSAVNNSVGAKTLLSSFVTGMLLLLTLLVLTPIFQNMSQNVQGAIIIVGVLQLFDIAEWRYLWKVNKVDWLVWNIVFLFVLFLGVEVGIGVGVGLSLLIVIYKTAFPRITTLGRLPNSDVYRNVKMYPGSEVPRGMLLLRIDAPIYYANVENIKDAVLHKLEKIKEKAAATAPEPASGPGPIKFVAIDMSPVYDIDATAVHFFHDFLRLLGEDGIQLVLANPSKQALSALKRGDLIQKIGADYVHVNMADAVAFCQAEMERRHKQETVEGV